MAVSRAIRTIWVTNYDKSIGDVLEYIASSAGYPPFANIGTWDGFGNNISRSTVTGVHEITKAGELVGYPPWTNVGGSKFWGMDAWEMPPDYIWEDIMPIVDYNLSAVATTITLDEDGANTLFDGVDVYNPGYLIIENEIMTYTGIDESSPWREIIGVTRGVLNTEAVEHDGTAEDMWVDPYAPGSVQSIEYDEEDEVYAVGVALPNAAQWKDPLPAIGYRQWEFTEYGVFRFEIPRDRVDLVVYDDTEYAASINGWITGFRPES